MSFDRIILARAGAWLWAAGGLMCIAAACGDDSGEPFAAGGRAGNSAVSGSGGVGGWSGDGGSAARSNFGGTSGCGPVNPIQSDAGEDENVTLVLGDGLAYPDGTAVTATITYTPTNDQTETDTTTVERGAFAFSFPPSIVQCSGRSLALALYVDVNGDGECQLETDDVFVRFEKPETLADFAPVSLAQDSERCPALPAARAPDVVAAARRLCPQIGDCLPFCSEPEPTASSPAGTFGGFCAESPDGGLDAGQTESGDAAVNDGG